MRVLDLCSGAGGAAMGLHLAWPDAEITGVDLVFQKNYPFRFVQGDALTVDLAGVDFVWASPPCQFGSEATPTDYRAQHANLIPAIRARLQAWGGPYIIENVEAVRKHLINPVLLCGSMLGLPVWRHRYFESNALPPLLLPPCHHWRGHITVCEGGETRQVQVPVLCTGGGDGRRSKRKTHRPRGKVVDIRWAMGIPWMIQSELTEAIPPAYSAFLARQLTPLFTRVAA